MRTKKEYIRFLKIAYGSGAELETQIEIVKLTAIVKSQDISQVEDLLEEVMKMLNVMIRKLQSSQ